MLNPAFLSPCASLHHAAPYTAVATSVRPTKPRSPTKRSKQGKRVAPFRKHQARRGAGPTEFRRKAKEEVKEAEAEAQRAAVEAATIAARRARKNDGTSLSELVVGTEMRGIVQNLVRHGAYVDIGAKRDGLVHVRDMALDFVHVPEDIVSTGDEVKVWVKYVNPVTNTIGLTMRKPCVDINMKKIKVSEVEIGRRYEGIVTRVTNFGAYVDVGCERLGFLHVNNLWGRRTRDTLDSLRVGKPIWVYVEDVDEVLSYIKLTARGKASMPLTEHGELGNEEKKQSPVRSREVSVGVVLERPGQAQSRDELEAQAHGDEEMAEGVEDRDGELNVEKDEYFAQEDGDWTWENIQNMFDESTEFVGMESLRA